MNDSLGIYYVFYRDQKTDSVVRLVVKAINRDTARELADIDISKMRLNGYNWQYAETQACR